jgi:TetR/AcrR family transcriptional regulator, transcriptional repressor for nem operon
MDTRTTLLESAEQAARQRGFDAFSYADLARDVGIKTASIHYHFPRKADLASSMIERYARRFLESLTQIERDHAIAAARVRAYLRVYRDALADGTQLCLCVAFSAGRDSLADPVLDQLTQFHADSTTWLTGVFEAGRQDASIAGISDPVLEARACLALVEGAQLGARAAKSVTPFDQAVAALQARLTV